MGGPSLRAQVEAALDEHPPETAVLVVDAEGKLLGEREPSGGGYAVIVVLGVDRDRIAWRPEF